MENKKYTQADIYTAIANYAQEVETINEIPSAVVIEFCEKKLTQLANKTSKSNSKKTTEQEAFMDTIRDVLAEGGENGKTCAEMLADPRIIGFAWADNKATSNSRLTSYLTKMGEPTAEHPERLGDVKKTVVKKVPYFSLA